MFYFSNLPTWLYLLHYLAWGIVLLTIFISWNLGFGEDKVSIGEFVILGGASFVSMAIIVATAIIYFSLGGSKMEDRRSKGLILVIVRSIITDPDVTESASQKIPYTRAGFHRSSPSETTFDPLAVGYSSGRKRLSK